MALIFAFFLGATQLFPNRSVSSKQLQPSYLRLLASTAVYCLYFIGTPAALPPKSGSSCPLLTSCPACLPLGPHLPRVQASYLTVLPPYLDLPVNSIYLLTASPALSPPAPALRQLPRLRIDYLLQLSSPMFVFQMHRRQMSYPLFGSHVHRRQFMFCTMLCRFLL